MGAAQNKLAFADEFLSKTELLFQGDTGDVKKCADDVATAVKKLKSALNRQRAKTIVELVQNGEFTGARKILKDNHAELESVNLEEILKLCIGSDGDDFLRNTIRFVDSIDEGMRPSACVAIYNEMRFRNRLGELEILLLWDKLTKCPDGVDNKKLDETKEKIAVDIYTLLKRMVHEIKNSSAELTVNAIHVCASRFFNLKIIPQVVDLFFEGWSADATLLVRLALKLPYLSNQCRVVHATFAQLKRNFVLESRSAMHLWALTCTLKKRVTLGEDRYLSQGDQKLFAEAHTELSLYKNAYYEILRKNFENNELDLLNGEIFTMSVIAPFVTWYYDGKCRRAKKLIRAANKTGCAELAECVLKAVYAEMEKLNHLDTCEAFKLYHSVTKKEIDILRGKIPKCISQLLGGDDKKFKIVNKYFGESLFLPSGVFGAVYSAPSTVKENLWSATLDEDSSLAVFTYSDGINQLGCESLGGVTTACAGSVGAEWMIRPVDDEYVKICTKIGEYLTADTSVCDADGNMRRVPLRSEDTTDMQVWLLEFES